MSFEIQCQYKWKWSQSMRSQCNLSLQTVRHQLAIKTGETETAACKQHIIPALDPSHPAQRGSSRSGDLCWRLGWTADASGTLTWKGTTRGWRWAGRWWFPWCTRTSSPFLGWSPMALSYGAQPHSSAWTWRSKALCMHHQGSRSNTALEVARWLTSEKVVHIVGLSTRSNRRC